MRRVLLLLSLLGLVLISVHGVSQTQGVLSKKWYGNWSMGIGGGPNIFFGDLKVYRFWPVSTHMNEWRYAGSFYLIRQLSHVFSLRGQVLYGEIAGTKRVYGEGAPCNQYFEGNILEYNLNTTINFSNLLFRYKPRRIFFIYGTVGAGLSNWITKKKDLITQEQIGGSGSTSNWTTEWVLPVGMGAYFNIYDKVNLGLEWTTRGVNSDLLDATPGKFPYDFYSFLSLNLVYNFNRRNPVELKSVESTLPPVVLHKPSVQPQEQPGPPVSKPADTARATKPVPLQTGVGKKEPAETATLPPPAEPVSETISPKPYQHPGLEADVFYRVQIFASSTGSRSAENLRTYFKLPQPVIREFSEGYYRYYVGEFENEPEAQQFARSLRLKRGLEGAFVVKYVNGVRELTHPK